MIYDLINVFTQEYETKGDKLILDNYELKEDIISLDKWIEFRNVRNELEHDYPDELEEALKDLKYCVESFDYMQEVVKNVFDFARRYDESIKILEK